MKECSASTDDGHHFELPDEEQTKLSELASCIETQVLVRIRPDSSHHFILQYLVGLNMMHGNESVDLLFVHCFWYAVRLC